MSELVVNLSDTLLLSFLILAAASLYSSVGHGGASGYLAAMALFGMAPSVMKPTALTLNILVSAIATMRFYRARCFSWRIFLIFAVTSIPLAYIGGMIELPGNYYRKIVGIVLIYAAVQLFRVTQQKIMEEARPVPVTTALISGAAIGLLSGLTGVGGGIFLSPLLLFMRWGDPRQTAGVSAAFIFVNSASGLLGHVSAVNAIPSSIAFFAVAAVIGGLLGSWMGSRYLSQINLRRLLSVVLVVAGIKFMFT